MTEGRIIVTRAVGRGFKYVTDPPRMLGITMTVGQMADRIRYIQKELPGYSPVFVTEKDDDFDTVPLNDEDMKAFRRYGFR